MAQGSAIGASHGHVESDISDLNHVGAYAHVDGGDVSAVAINSLTDITVKTTDVTGVVAGDLLIVRVRGSLFNDSGGSRTVTITPSFNDEFSFTYAMFTTPHASNRNAFDIEYQLSVRNSSNADAIYIPEYDAGDGAAPGIVTVRSFLYGWDTVAADLTGTVTVAYKVKSNDVAATQEMLVYSFTVEKLSST